MALELYDRVKETTTTTGTGTIALAGAVTGYVAFGSVLADADTTYYAIDGGSEWEVGRGTIGGSGTTLARTQVLASSNGGSAVNFSAGTKTVFATIPAALFSTAVATFLATPSSANLASLVSDDSFALNDAELGAIAGLTSAADRLPYFTGSGTAALATFTAGGRALVNSAGTSGTFPYFSGSNTVTLATITTAGRNLLDDADAAAQRTTMGAAASGAVTSSGLTMATARILGRTTASTGAIEELSQVPYSLGGTNATTAWTQGSVIFAGASSLAQDNANLYWDDTNNFLGIGGVPAYRLDVQHNANAAHGIAMRNANTGASSQAFMQCATGTANAFFNVACLDNAGAPYAQFSVGSAIAAFFLLSDTQVFSSTAGVENMRLTGTGLGIGTTPSSKLTVNGPMALSAPVTKTGNFTLAASESSIIVNNGSSTTVTLPSASSWPGRWLFIKTIQAQTVVSASSNVVPLTSATAGTAMLPATDGAWGCFQSDGSNWIQMMGSAV